MTSWTHAPITRIGTTTSIGPRPDGVSLSDELAAVSARIDDLQEVVMAYSPGTDVTKISGAIVSIASSASSAALTLGRQHLVTGSAAQTLTVATPTVNGTIVSVKVDDAYTGAGVTMPTGMQQAGVLTAGQDFDWFWNGSAWNIE